MMYNALNSTPEPQPHDLPEPVNLAASSGDGRFYSQYGKRGLDLVGAILLLLVFSPLILVICLLQLFQGGPVLFSHDRVGRSGESFGCLKFRTMATDADQRLTDLLQSDPEARQEWRETQKLSDDPRITRLGHILRRSSMDELPQLLNVLKGEMSLVGPRPVTEAELARYGDAKGCYLAVRPGLTGKWQVGGRNDLSYDQRVLLDSDYAASFTLTGDLVILLRTVGVVLGASGR